MKKTEKTNKVRRGNRRTVHGSVQQACIYSREQEKEKEKERSAEQKKRGRAVDVQALTYPALCTLTKPIYPSNYPSKSVQRSSS